MWEPQLASVLAEAGVAYTVLDDIHFLSAGFEQEELFGDYLAEDKGQTIRIIPGQKTLRYLIPWDTVDKVMVHLQETFATHPDGIAAMGDDMEKFGGWPGTFEHCFQEGWLDNLFAAFKQNSSWLRCLHAGRVFDGAQARRTRRFTHRLVHRDDGMGASHADAATLQRAA